ncbi:MAG: sn-glycerol-1-phosphate dehydrogenase [Clostridia bacterium]|nr:sn-glycerol-1-phosphate dehydrogenase [Clostridia bacterium]
MKVSQLINHDINCSCGRVHRCDIPHLNIGSGALNDLPNMVAHYKNILLVADNNTYGICGDKVRGMLGGKIADVCILTADGFVVPDRDSVAKVEGHMVDSVDFVLGIGSGVINDICKYVSYTHKITCGIIATATSMDGYASSGAAMIFDGMKITYTMHAPVLILGDTEILKDAPMDMIAAGYADIIGKYSALCDWKLSELINGEYLCPYVYDIVMQSTNEVRSLAQKIYSRDEEAIGRLMEILVLVGVCLTLLGTTRPGSGSEHHLSHFFEITGLIEDKPYFLHGTDVGYSTVVTAALREKICRVKTPVFKTVTDEERMKEYKRIYQSEWESVWKLQQQAGQYAKNPVQRYADKWQDIIAILAQCPTAEQITQMLTEVGFDMSEFEKMYGQQKIIDGISYGKDLKDRYSVLWLYSSLDMMGEV